MNLKKLQNLPNTRLGKILNAVRWFNGYSILPPSFVELVLTYRCNLKCSFCLQDKARGAEFPDMSLESARKIEANIRGSFPVQPRIHFFGGEPTVNRDFEEILRHFSERGYRLSMTTNGNGLGDRLPRLASTVGLREMNLSLNEADRGSIQDALGRLQALPGCRLKVNLSCPITSENHGDLVSIAREFADSPVTSVTFQHAIFPFRQQFDTSALREQVKKLKGAGGGSPVHFLPDLQPDDIDSYYRDPGFPYGQSRCVLPWFDVFTLPNGDVAPCDQVDVVVGNLCTDRLADIWNGSAYRQFRKGIQENGISHPICQRCCHRQYY